MSIYGQTHPIDTIRIDSAQILFTPTRTQFFEHMLSDSSAATGLDLGELLSKNSSIHINNYGAGSSQSISLRGTGSQHTKVYWNGFAIESPTLGSTDLSTVAGVLNNGVDVLPGLSSNRLGSGGLGGAISINADSFDDNNSFGLSLGGNSLLSRQIQAHANLNLNQWDYAINFFSNQEENRFSFVNNAQYEAPLDTMENAAFEQYSLNQAIRYKTDKHEFWNRDFYPEHL